MKPRQSGYLWVVALAALGAAGGCDIAGAGRAGPITVDRFIGQEAPLTILLAEYQGPDGQATARRICDEMVSKGLDETFVVADDDEAYLCHGLYKDRLEKKHERDKQKIQLIQDTAGRPIFGRGFTVLLPETTPPTPHDLSEATGKYTVMVGSFDLYGRKHMAVDYAGRLRRAGWEAYAYHGDTMSHVTIGSFGPEIFKSGFDVSRLSPRDRAIMEDFTHQQMFNEPGEMAPIASPEVKRIIAALPYLNWNGHVFTAEEAAQLRAELVGKMRDPKDRTTKEYRRGGRYEGLIASRLVVIPKSARRLNPNLPVPQRASPGPILSPSR